MNEQLKTLLSDGFDLNELRDLCFDLQVDKDNFSPNKDAFIRDLLGYFERRKEIKKLIDKCCELRPNSDWPELPDSPELRLQTLKQEIAVHAVDIAEIFAEIINFLKKLEKLGISELDEDSLQDLEKFVQGQLSGEVLISTWSNKQSGQATTQLACNYSDLAERLKLGEIVVFLGNRHSDDLVSKLADTAEYNSFQGSFSEICEYMENAGRQTLLRKLKNLAENDLSQQANNRLTLYQLLSKIPTPLLLISAAYDSILEDSFRQQNKPFKLVTHCSQPSDLGVFLVRDFGAGPAEKYTAESLSELAPMENGFSLIYKIRGCFNTDEIAGQKDTLTLSERDYFNIARHLDNLIPDYIANKLNALSLWYLGHHPDSWEERLLIHVLQNKRARSGQTLAIQAAPSQFAEAYWKAKHVDLFELELSTFIDEIGIELKAS